MLVRTVHMLQRRKGRICYSYFHGELNISTILCNSIHLILYGVNKPQYKSLGLSTSDSEKHSEAATIQK